MWGGKGAGKDAGKRCLVLLYAAMDNGATRPTGPHFRRVVEARHSMTAG